MSKSDTVGVPPVLAGLFWLFAIFWAILVMHLFFLVGNQIGIRLYSFLSSRRLIKPNSMQDHRIIIECMSFLLQSIAFLIIPILDRGWIKHVKFGLISHSDLKLTVLLYLLLFIFETGFLQFTNNGVAARAAIKSYDGTLWLDIALSFGFAVAAPLAEELYFRGWMWERVGAEKPRLAALLTGVTWLMLHLPNATHTLLLVPLASILTLLRLRTSNIIILIIFHVSNNSYVVLDSACRIYLDRHNI